MTERVSARNIYYSFFSNVRGVSNVPVSYPTYIETDASGSRSVFSMAPHFKNLHSIQLRGNVKESLKNSYTGQKINWYSNSGSSLGSLSSIISNIKTAAFVYCNYNNFSKDHDCKVIDYVRAINSNSDKKTIICIDSFGLIDNCLTVSESENESNSLLNKLKEICKNRLNKCYNVGSTSSARYRVILDLNSKNGLNTFTPQQQTTNNGSQSTTNQSETTSSTINNSGGY